MSPKALQVKSKRTEESEPEEQKPITFYAWNEGYPSSMTIRISGGEKKMDGAGQIAVPDPAKHIKFNVGVYSTDDPDTIAVLRKQAKMGAEIAEGPEGYLKFLDKTQKPEDKAARAVADSHVKDGVIASQAEIIEQLRSELAAKS